MAKTSGWQWYSRSERRLMNKIRRLRKEDQEWIQRAVEAMGSVSNLRR